MTRRFAARLRRPWRAPRTRRGWLITIALAVATLAVKLIGAGLALVLLHHLLH
jgi:hypothetical protein